VIVNGVAAPGFAGMDFGFPLSAKAAIINAAIRPQQI
jgi:hypothetical protein